MNLQILALNYIENKDDKSFEKLYKRITPGLRKYISKFFIDKYENCVDDVLSKTFYKAIKNINQYNSDYNFSTWIYKIAKNESLQELNKNKKFIYFSQFKNNDDTVFDPTTISEIINKTDYIDYINYERYENELKINQLYLKAIEEINNLDDLYKSILIDREINKLKYKDLAIKYNLNESTLKSRIRLGRLKLRKVLQKYKDLNNV